jgi:hypothetical protein
MQSEPFPSCQRSLEEGRKTSNCRTPFGMAKIPTDHHIGSTLDPVHPSLWQPAFEGEVAEVGGSRRRRSREASVRSGVSSFRFFLVFQGAKTRPVRSSDFVALSQAPSLPKDLRTALVAMESASASQRQVGAASSLGASFSANPDQLVRRLRGTVTMIDAPSKLSAR